MLDPSRSTLDADRTTNVLANGVDAVVLTVTLRDQHGDPMPNLVVSLEVEGDGGVVTQPPLTDAEGVARGVLRSTRHGLKTVKALVGSSPAIELPQRATVEFGSGPATRLAFTTQPAATIAGSALSPSVGVAVLDEAGSHVTSTDLEITLSLSGGPPGVMLEGATTAPAAEGVATFDDLVIPQAGTGYRLLARAEGLEPVESTSFDVTAGPAAALVFTSQPSDHVAGGAMNPLVAVKLVDARGNLVRYPSIPVALTLRSPPGQTGRLAGSTRVDTINGVATFDDLLIVTAGEGFTLVALATGLPQPESAPFTVTPAAPNESMSFLTADPTEILADGVASTTVTLQVSDGYGNRVAGRQVALDVSGDDNVLAPAAGVTDGNGEFVTTLTSSFAETKVITASFDAFDLTTTVKFVPGPPSLDRSSLTADPSAVVADGVTATTLTARVVDEADNPVPGVPVTFSSTGSGNTLSPTSGTTNADGLVVAALTSTRAETKSITAAFASHTLTQFVVFQPGAPSAVTSTLQAAPSSAIADGLETSTLVLVVRDAEGNPIQGEPVSLEITGTDNTLSMESGLTDASGEFLSTLASTRAEAKTVTATFANRSLTTPVTFLPGALNLAQSTLDAAPASLVADGVTVTALTVRARDAFGNPRPGEPVTFSVTGSENTLTAGGPSTDAGGELTATLASARAETKTVTATFAGGGVTREVLFVPGAPSEASSSLTVDPPSLVADGVAAATITVRVVDALDNPVAGEWVTLTVSGTANTLAPAAGTTDENGLFVGSLASTRHQEKNVTATFGDSELSKSITFFPIPANPEASRVVAGPTPLPADGVAAATITVTLTNEEGNPMPDVNVTLSISGDGTLFEQPAPTDSEGVTSTTLRSIRPGIKTVTATVLGVTLQEQPQVTFDPAYRIAGVVSGLTGTGLRVKLTHGVGDPGFDEIAVESAGEIQFPTIVANGTAFQVTLASQPSEQRCIIENDEGVVNDSDVTDVRVRCGSIWKQIASSDSHTLGIQHDGSLWAWGRNEFGQLGDGTNTSRASPVRIGTGFRSIGVGQTFSVGLKNDGTVWVCGRHRYNKEDGTSPDPRTLHRITGTYAQISTGDTHTLALGTDGRLWSWGHNYVGQVGDGSSGTYRNRPVMIGSGFMTISAKGNVSMAIKNDGSLWGWGYNRYGQIGVGTTGNVHSPAAVGTGYRRVYAGWYTTHAIKEDGTVWAWGRNDVGQLGDGTTTEQHVPVPIGESFSKVLTSMTHSVALKEDGSLWAWGGNAFGQIGDGSIVSRLEPVLVGEGYIDVDTYKDATFAIKTDGTAWAWGSNEGGKFGDGSGWREEPVQIGSGFASVAAGLKHSLAVKTDGTLWAWGENTRGQLGIGTLESKGTPQLVGSGFASVAAGYDHSVATKLDGTAWSWGGNAKGQLGRGNTEGSQLPVLIGEFISVAANANHNVGIKADATVWSWGSNIAYRSDNGSSSEHHSPVHVASDFHRVAAGTSHALGIRAPGSLWGWGSNLYNAIGDGINSLDGPAELGFSAMDVAAGYLFTVAVKPDGTLWTWGFNDKGQLGNGTTATDAAPAKQIGTLYLQVTAGFDFALGIKEQGLLMAWGANHYGQLGVGSMESRTSPVLMGSGYSQVAGGWRHTLAVKEDGSLWAWGDNSYGAVGDGHGASTVPVFIE